MAAPRKKPSIIFDKKPASPFTDKLKKKPAKVDWVEKMKADAKSPKKPTPKHFGKFESTKADWKAVLKESPIHGPDYGVGENPEAPRIKNKAKDLGVGKNPMAPRAKPASTTPKISAGASKAAGYGAKAAKVLSYGSKLLGKANPVIGQITSAKALNVGETEWLANKGPLMKGNSKPAAAGAGKLADGRKDTGWRVKYDSPIGPKANPNLGYGTFNKPMPAAPKQGPKTSYPAPSAAPAQSTSTFPGSKGSTKDSVVSPGTQTKRGAVTTAQAPAPKTGGLQTRYQRDSGLAMDSRKRK